MVFMRPQREHQRDTLTTLLPWFQVRVHLDVHDGQLESEDVEIHREQNYVRLVANAGTHSSVVIHDYNTVREKALGSLSDSIVT